MMEVWQVAVLIAWYHIARWLVRAGVFVALALAAKAAGKKTRRGKT